MKRQEGSGMGSRVLFIGILLALAIPAQAQTRLIYERKYPVPLPNGPVWDMRENFTAANIAQAISTHVDVSSDFRVVTPSSFPTAAVGGRGVWYSARYFPATDTTELQMVDSPTAYGQVIYRVTGYRIDALALGTFAGSNGYKLIVPLNGTHGQQTAVWAFDTYTTTPGWTFMFQFSTKKVTALAAGDFDGTGRQRLAYGLGWLVGSGAELWITDFAPYANQTVPLGLGSGYSISALAAGKFRGTGSADLVTALSWTDGVRTGSSLWRHAGATQTKQPYFEVDGTVWNYTKRITGLTTGRFSSGATTDELMVARVDVATGPEIIFPGVSQTLPNWFIYRDFQGEPGQVMYLAGMDYLPIVKPPSGSIGER